MRAAYLFQAVNLTVSILTVPLLLHYLDVSGYVLWSVFTVFGAVTLQLQNGIQPVAVREIAREYRGGTMRSLTGAIKRVRHAYYMLTVFVVGPLLIAGIAYLHFVAGPKLGTAGIPEWFVFVGGYALNYAFAANSAILLGMVRIAQQNNINSVTRALYFTLSFLLLRAGYSVMGICIGFVVSVILSCALITRAARQCTNKHRMTRRTAEPEEPKTETVANRGMRDYLLYSISAYLLYNGALLVATAIFPKEKVASYTLSVQVFALMSAFSIVPIQVWLNRLVGAVTRRDRVGMLHELAATLVTANAVFVAGFIVLALFGNLLLVLLGSKVQFLRASDLSLIFAAFLVELNIVILVNFLVTSRRYEFVRIYLVTSGMGLVLAALAAWLSHRLLLSLVVVPVTLQCLVCLPLIFGLACSELEVSRREFFVGTAAFLRSLV